MNILRQQYEKVQDNFTKEIILCKSFGTTILGKNNIASILLSYSGIRLITSPFNVICITYEDNTEFSKDYLKNLPIRLLSIKFTRIYP